MKRQMIARARVNVRLLVILLLVVVGLGVAAVAARQVRRNILASRALAAGQDACQRGDWPEARKQLREYLSRRPDDLPVLEQYAKAELSIEPIEERNIRWAVGAYRQLLRYDPKHREAYHELARLYAGMRNFDELGYITRLCLDHFPDDPTAKVWLAKSLITRRDNDQASEYLLGLVEDIEQRQQKCPEYADACRLLSGIALQQKGENVVEEAFKWLDRAVAYDPNHAESYVARSRFYRTAPAFSGKSRAELVELARRDLERADSLTPADPRVRLAIAAEWMELGDADRAAAQIAAIDGLPRETVMPYFLDYNDWLVALFVQKSELAFAGNDATASAAALADQTLGRLEQERHRIRVLPSAVKIYLSGRRVAVDVADVGLLDLVVADAGVFERELRGPRPHDRVRLGGARLGERNHAHADDVNGSLHLAHRGSRESMEGGASGLLQLDAGVPDDLAPAGSIRRDDGGQFFGRAADGTQAHRFETPGHFGRLDDPLDLARQLVDDRLRRAGRHEGAETAVGLVAVDPRFGEGRDVGKRRMSLQAGDREQRRSDIAAYQHDNRQRFAH